MARSRGGLSHQGQVRRWRGYINEQASSGLTQAAYCAQHQISLSRFRAWKYRKLRRLDGARPPDRSVPELHEDSLSFVPVEVLSAREIPGAMPPTDAPLSGVELQAPGGPRILLRRGFDSCTLQRLLEVLDC